MMTSLPENDYCVRWAQKSDCSQIYKLLLKYSEQSKSPCNVCQEEFEQTAFREGAFVKIAVAIQNSIENIVGFVLSFARYSTWKGRHLFIEVVFIEEAHRGKRIMSSLFKFLGEYAIKKEFAMCSLEYHNWNIRARDIYKHFGFEDTNEVWEKYELGTSDVQSLSMKFISKDIKIDI